MGEKKMDRRVKRTRKLLKQGLSELLSEKSFSDISAREICDRMDLNRATFYLHYKNTYELLQDLEEDLLEDVQVLIDQMNKEYQGDSLRPLFEILLDFVMDNRMICQALFTNNASSDFTGRVYAFIGQNGWNIMKEKFPNASEEKMKYILNFNAYGLVGMIRRWFESNTSMPREELIDLADELLGLSNVLLTE